MGAAFLCGHCGIDAATLTESTSYIAGWLKALQNDTRMVVLAAAQAQKAAYAEPPEPRPGRASTRQSRLRKRERHNQGVGIRQRISSWVTPTRVLSKKLPEG